MSTLAPDPFGFTRGSNIANLVASIARRFGFVNELAPLANAAVFEAIQSARSVILVLMDGVGTRQIEALAPGGTLAAHGAGTLTSLFPSSTAPSVACFASALTPAQHANTGWLMWSDEVGAVIRTLPSDVRGNPHTSVDPAHVWRWRPLADQLTVPVICVLPEALTGSSFSRFAWRGAQRIPYESYGEIAHTVSHAVTGYQGGALVYVYLSEFDSASHAFGWQSGQALNALLQMDTLFDQLAKVARATEAVLIATADHGFLDISAECQLRLGDFPSLSAMLERPLSGEPRVAYCQVAATAHENFCDRAEAELGGRFQAFPSQALIDAGWFGPGPVAPELLRRVGTHTLVAHAPFTLVDAVPNEAPASFIGMHGGTHPDELTVPLLLAR